MNILLLTSLLATTIILNGCAVLGSDDYYSSYSEIGKAKWHSREKNHITGEPNSTNYLINGMEIKVNSIIGEYTYSLGPCPLPIIPVFGLGSYNNEYININVSLRKPNVLPYTSKDFILTKANLNIDNKIFTPESIHELRTSIT